MAGSRLLFGTLLLLLVTLSQGLQCTVVVGQLEYDLSELAAEDHWQIHGITDTGYADQVIYLSLCHPLRNVPSGCAGNDTGVCIAEVSSENTTNVIVPNAGRVSPHEPTIPHEQWVEYVMEGGIACPQAEGETYRTSINFLCSQTPEEETGPVLMNYHRCQLLLAWMTQAACPRRLDAVTTTPCSIQFPSSDHKLHLQTLRAEHYYSASSALGKYEINICGPVVNGSCNSKDVAVCHMSESRNPEVLATTDNMRVRWEEDNKTLSLAYQASDQGQDVEVKFTCDRGTAKTEINYVTQNDTSVTFVVKTSAVCPPTPAPSCVLENHVGDVYDLRPLHRAQGNWEVVESTSDGQVLYYLNICGAVNSARPYTCPPGLIGSCIPGIGEKAAYNLGLLTSEPTINTEDGSITVLYSGGDPCKEGQHSHSTRINLICNAVEHGPILIEETETCEHVFDWLTPVACPRHVTTGSNCQVKDPLYGNVYDLNPLRNIYKDYKVTSDENEFLINLCGPLVSSCDGQNGTAGVCQVSKDKQFNAGLHTSQMTFNDGTLMMKYPNGTSGCEGNNTRYSQVIFLCDHEISGRDGPTFFHQYGCSNNFFWKTKYACPPFHVVDCILYTAEGMMYDLQDLSSSDTNLEYYTTDDKKFILNVCRSVVHQKGSRCPYRAGACIIDRTHLNSSVNIGEVQSGPYLEDGRLMMRYAGGDPCVGHTQLYQTLIEFKCDKHKTFSIPQFIGEENCTYYFEIISAAACPVSVENTTMPLVGRNCSVTSPSGYTFDLNPLKQETGYLVNGSKNTLTLNVCAAVNNPECPGEGVGVCSKNGNAGQANANLYYLPEHLSLHYTGGKQCSDDVSRSTIITFVCGAENVTEGPVLVFDDDEHCVYFITWHTELACEKRISCFVDTWTHRIDLSPLIKSTGNYEAVNSKNPKEKFHLNVCRPLNPIIGLNCRPGSAVCISSLVKGKNPLSLGHPNVTPVSDSSGGAIIMYTHGAKCVSEPDYNYSSKIHFICDPSAGKGSPVFKETTHDCQYLFEWRTSVACDMLFEEEDSGPQCQIRYDEAKANIDLKPLYLSEGYSVKFGNKIFTINICGPACNTSGSCSSDGDSYGLSNKSSLEWNYGQLTLVYYGGSYCNKLVSGHKITTIHFECDMSVGFGFPVPDELMESLDCHAVFNWKTNVTCIEGIYATEDTPSDTSSSHNRTAGQHNPSNDSLQHNPSNDSLKGKTTTTHALLSTVIASILVVSGVIFVVALVLIKSRRGNHIIAVTRRLFGIHGYTRSQSQVENSTLLGTTSSIRVFRTDDSDDDLLRV